MTKSLRLPSTDADGNLYQHVGRYAGQMVVVAFDMAGGVDRLADWADKNYGEFITKVFPKVIAKPVEHTVSEGVESLLERLDAGDRSTLIEGTATWVDDDANG